ncbi:AraC family transcriptional regulator [Leucobacter celer]|jgi:AraC-like DNA-binding protein|uniref:AraC family transcriptional regulator n=1 Tax=Leucobacter celer TaxID=668625 RepID=UPI0006A774C9|nr:AraC family transcriptional regulator [Leucobacter celer]
MSPTTLPTRAESPLTAEPAARDGLDGRDAAIDRVLAGFDARVHRQHRVTLRSCDVVAIPRSSIALVYVIDGALRVDGPGGASEELVAGDARMITDRRAHSLRAAQHAFALVSSLDLTESAAHLLELLPGAITVRELSGSDPAVAALAAQLGPELDGDDAPCSSRAGDAVVCRMMANTVLVSVIRAWVVRGCAPDGWPSRTNDRFLDRVVEAIHADPGRDWTLEDLARTGAMSRSVFAARFRSATGISPANYVTDVRIRSAQDLLARGWGVSEVSRAIGYGSDEGFSRAFRRRIGVTPSAWRSCAIRGAEA